MTPQQLDARLQNIEALLRHETRKRVEADERAAAQLGELSVRLHDMEQAGDDDRAIVEGVEDLLVEYENATALHELIEFRDRVWDLVWPADPDHPRAPAVVRPPKLRVVPPEEPPPAA